VISLTFARISSGFGLSPVQACVHLVIGPDHEDRGTGVIAALFVLLQQAPVAARGPSVVVEHEGLHPRRPRELPRLVRLGYPEADQGARGQVDLLFLGGQSLEVLDVLLVAGTVGSDHHRPPNGPHAQPELSPLGARQVELGGLGPHLRYRRGLVRVNIVPPSVCDLNPHPNLTGYAPD
jgi:hypothetical protein